MVEGLNRGDGEETSLAQPQHPRRLTIRSRLLTGFGIASPLPRERQLGKPPAEIAGSGSARPWARDQEPAANATI
jgi:hypothetical protein